MTMNSAAMDEANMMIDQLLDRMVELESKIMRPANVAEAQILVDEYRILRLRYWETKGRMLRIAKAIEEASQ